MSKQDMMKIQTCVLKVNIHCDGCEQKVKKLLQKIEGVYSVGIDAEQGKVVVSGHVDPAKLIKKLKRAGKHAELWGGQRGSMMFNQNYPPKPQFKNLHIDPSKGGKNNNNNKSQNQKGQKGGGGQQAQFQNMKGTKDLKVPSNKDQKNVKFNLSDDDFDDGGYDGLDEFDDYNEFDDDFDDDYDEEDDDEEEEEEEFGHGNGNGHGHGGHGHAMQNKMMPVMMGSNGRGPQGLPAGVGVAGGMMMNNGPAMNKGHNGTFGGGGGGGGNYGGAKKGDVIDLPIQMKGGKGGNFNEGKNGNGGNKNNNGGDHHNGGKNENKGGKNNKGGSGDSKKKGGKSKSGGGGFLVKFLGLGKKSKKGGSDKGNKNKSNGNGGGGGNNNKGKDGKKNGGGKFDKVDFGFEDFDMIPPSSGGKNGKGGGGKGNNKNNGTHHGGGNNNGNMGQMGSMGQRGPMGPMGPMSQMGHQIGPMEHMRNIPAVQGLPAGAAAAMNGGYYQGMGMQPNPYSIQQQQQQQYMAMMMNQQQQQQQQQAANMNMYPAHMMYGRPHPSMNYMPPPPMPSHPMADPITHVFSDENTESCIIM